MTTGTDWRTLPAGAPLDACVAERVMGLVYSPCRSGMCDGEHWYDQVGGDVATYYDSPAYSTTGDGMLLVMARMRERGYVGLIVQADDGGWVVDYSVLEDDGTYRVLGRAEVGHVRDIPCAVVRAALAALEGMNDH